MGETIGRQRDYGYGAITLYGPAFNPVRLARCFMTSADPVRGRTRFPTTPDAQRLTAITRGRFSLFRFRSPLLTEYLFLQVLRCFTSLRTPARMRCRPMTAGGLPHSEILGSKPCWRLPETYRSLIRPSSVLSAKASTIRPCKQRIPMGYPCRKIHNPSLFPDNKSSHYNDHKTIDRLQIQESV